MTSQISVAAVIDPSTRRISIAVEDGTRNLVRAARVLDDSSIAIADLALRRPTLDEVFLALTGEGVAAPGTEASSGNRAGPGAADRLPVAWPQKEAT